VLPRKLFPTSHTGWEYHRLFNETLSAQLHETLSAQLHETLSAQPHETLSAQLHENLSKHPVVFPQTCTG